MILQADQADDFVLATGETYAVRTFVEAAFAEVDRKIEWKGEGVEETGVDPRSGRTLVRVDPLWLEGVYGLIILVAVSIDALVGRRSRKGRHRAKS